MMPRPRYIAHPGTLLPFHYSSEITRHCSILVTRWPPSPSTFHPDPLLGTYAGPTGIAYTFFTLRNQLPPSIGGQSPVEWARAYLRCAKTLGDGEGKGGLSTWPLSSKACGWFIESLAQTVLSAAIEQEPEQLEGLWASVPAILDDEAPELPFGPPMGGPSDDWGLGRATFLHVLRFIKYHLPSTSAKVDEVTPLILQAIMRRAPASKGEWGDGGWITKGRKVTTMWFWIIAEILLSDPSPSRLAQTRPWIVGLLGMQLPSGNWPQYIDDGPNSDEQTEIGHGAPGNVVALHSIRQAYHADAEMVSAIDRAIDKAQDWVWTHGYLTKESCLAHGTAGNALALTDPARQATFLAYSTQEQLDTDIASGKVEASNGSSGSGLCKGLAGRISAMVACEQGRPIFETFDDF